MVALLVLLAAAGGVPAAQAPSPAAAPPRLLEVPLPDLDGLDPAVAGQLGQVRAALDAAHRHGAPGASAFGEAGRHYHAYGILRAAEACYRNAEALDPEDFRWPYLLALVLEEAHRLEDAHDAFLRALEGPDTYYPALLHLGRVRLALGRLVEAEEALAPARRHAPDDPAMLAIAGELALARGRHAEAAELLAEALQREPRATRLHHPLALAHRALGHLEQARAALSRAGTAGIRPKDPVLEAVLALRRGQRAHLLAAERAYAAGDYAAAAEAYGRAVRASREPTVAMLVGAAAAEGRRGRCAEAIVHLERARALEPDNPTVLFNLAVCLVGLGRGQEAEPLLKQVVATDPRDDAARAELAKVLLDTGRVDEALAELERVEKPGAACAELVARLSALQDGPSKLADRARALAGTLASACP